MATITKTLAGINDPGALIDCKSYSNALALGHIMLLHQG